jgi:hypothetical protein
MRCRVRVIWVTPARRNSPRTRLRTVGITWAPVPA